MPEELLLEELETADSLLENLEKIDDALRYNARALGLFLERMKGTALAFENAWRKIIINVAKGKTAEMQAERTGVLNDFETRLDILKKGHASLTSQYKGGWTDLDPDFLLSEIATMERLKARVLDRWQSTEDLERLAVEHYPLSQAQLEQIAATQAPPASWYEGEEETLFQE